MAGMEFKIVIGRKPVVLEAGLEEAAGELCAEECEAVARRLYRRAKQLYRKADILRSYRGELRPRRRR